MKETAATGWHAIHGDALLNLREMRGAGFSAIITDPPYASGGMSMAERSRSTRDKYTSYGEQGNPYPDFSGDALAQRAWTNFFHEIMVAARAACKPGAVCALFVDWRQLPALTDAIQWAGWVWRGVAVWDKMNSRPQIGRFRQQCEYIVWGSNGPLPTERGVGVLPDPDCFKCRMFPPMSGGTRHKSPLPSCGRWCGCASRAASFLTRSLAAAPPSRRRCARATRP